MKQKIFELQCPKCHHEFDAHSYSTFSVDVPIEVPEIHGIVNHTILIKAAPCPMCMCGTPLDPDSKWRMHETNSSSNAQDGTAVDDTLTESKEGNDTHMDAREREDASSQRNDS